MRSPGSSAQKRVDAPHFKGARAAQSLRFELGLDVAPIGDLWGLLAERGVVTAFRDFGFAGGDGLYLWNGVQGLVVLNSAMPPLRKRFTAAHELGHHEMHRPAKQQLLLADSDVDAEPTNREREANAFAAHLLAPDRALRQELAGRSAESIEPLDVVRLSRRYGLSYASLMHRLIHSGCVGARDRARLQSALETKEVTALTKAIGFDPEKVFPTGPALPDEYALTVVALHGREVVSDERLAELLRMPVNEALALAMASVSEVDGGDSSDPELDALLAG